MQFHKTQFNILFMLRQQESRVTFMNHESIQNVITQQQSMEGKEATLM